MATIGLDKLFYAEITEDSDGNETYGVPASLAKAISADLSVELAEATLYADDGASEIVKEFKSGTLSLGVDDIGNHFHQRGRRQARGYRVQGEEIQRQVPLFLAVQSEVRNSVNLACNKGRQYNVFHADNRRNGSPQKQAGRQRKAPVESGSHRGREERSGQRNHGLVQVCV